MSNTQSRPWPSLLPALALVMIASRPVSGAPQIAIEWQSSLGGSACDILSTAQPTPDGGFLLGGSSSSSPGPQKSSLFYGGSTFEGDFWIVRLDAAGNKLWDRSFGGATNEALYSLLVTEDGGFLAVGHSSSPPGGNGNKTSPNRGLKDFFVVRGDANGNKLWDATFGGGNDDIAYGALTVPGAGFLLVGYSLSPANGNKSCPGNGLGDLWVVRIDANGNKLWDACYGGSGDDVGFGAVPAGNGGFLLAGSSDSDPSGNKSSPNRGGADLWAVRIDANGLKLWDRSFGGDCDDGFFTVAVAAAGDGGVLLGGDSCSDVSGNKSSPGYGRSDFWIVRLDANGTALWDQSYGGPDEDFLTSIRAGSDGAWLLAGGSESNPGDAKDAVNRGRVDLWAVRVSDDGTKLWDESFGGALDDGFFNAVVLQTGPCTFLVGGDSQSPVGGNKTAPPLGQQDYWVVQWRPRPTLFVPAQTLASIQAQGARLRLRGEAGCAYAIEASQDLVSWTEILNHTLNGMEAELTDLGATNQVHRFYRARHLP